MTDAARIERAREGLAAMHQKARDVSDEIAAASTVEEQEELRAYLDRILENIEARRDQLAELEGESAGRRTRPGADPPDDPALELNTIRKEMGKLERRLAGLYARRTALTSTAEPGALDELEALSDEISAVRGALEELEGELYREAENVLPRGAGEDPSGPTTAPDSDSAQDEETEGEPDPEATP